MAKTKQTNSSNAYLGYSYRPILAIFVLAFLWVHVVSQPLWIGLIPLSLFSVGLPLYFERKLILELFCWKTVGALVGVVLAVLLYFGFLVTTEYISNASIQNSVAKDGSMPTFFLWMLEAKTHLSAAPFVVTLLGGMLLLSVCEAVFWRGYVLTRFMLHFSHPVSVIATALLYGGFYFLLMGPVGGIVALVSGLFLTTMTVLYRSLIPGIMCHSLLWAASLFFPII